MFERMTYLHNMICTLFEKLRDKESSDWLSLEQTCEMLNVSERKVRTMQATGKIGFARHGKRCCYKAEDVYNLIIKEGTI